MKIAARRKWLWGSLLLSLLFGAYLPAAEPACLDLTKQSIRLQGPSPVYFQKEPIILNAIEKSASVFIGAKLCRGLNLTLYGITSEQAWFLGFGDIVPQQLDAFTEAKGFSREHLFPTRENIKLLQEKNLKMIFHVRDLRQRVVSFAYYHFRLFAEENPQIITWYEKQGFNVRAWTIEDFIEYYILDIPDIVQRIQGWLEVYHKGTIPMLITTYEEFMDDEVRFFERILTFYGIPYIYFQWVDVSKDKVHNFRSGTKDEWRAVLTLEQQNRINTMIPDELFKFFHWER